MYINVLVSLCSCGLLFKCVLTGRLRAENRIIYKDQ